MKRKGFTLIELLAVIVVLAIIAIIAIPIITSVIDKAKVGALKDSAYGILDASELYLAKNMSEGIDDTIEFTCSNGKCINGDKEITYKGQIDEGKVRIYSDNKIELCITNNKNAALKTVDTKEVIVETGTCKYNELSYDVNELVSKDDFDEINKKYNDLKALVDQTNITADDIVEGKKAYSDGEVVTGTYKGMKKILLGTTTSYNLKTDYETYGLSETDYEIITADNFLVVITAGVSSGWGHVDQTGIAVRNSVIAYNDGLLTITAPVLGYTLPYEPYSWYARYSIPFQVYLIF